MHVFIEKMPKFMGTNDRHMKELKYDAFICYSQRDAQIANVIDDIFNEAGLSTFFFSKQILPGTNFQEVIVNTINSSELILFLCTRNSIQSNWTKNEVMYAIELGKTVVPIIVDDTEIPADLIFYLAKFRQWHVRSKTIESDVREIVERLKHILKTRNTSADSGSEALPPDKSDGKSIGDSKGEVEEPRKRTFGSILREVGICIGLVIYVLLIYLAFADGNYLEGVGLLIPVALGLIAYVYMEIRSRVYELKLYCEAEGDIESKMTVTVDDEIVSSVIGKGLVRVKKMKGDYLISVDSDNPEIAGARFKYTFGARNGEDLKEVTLKRKAPIDATQSKGHSSEVTEFTCFIAGSTRLVNERNATRAVLSILYNKWNSHNLVISSYTFEDFSNSHQIGGQQMQYNDFIKNKATCAIFIVTENVGEKTLEEYRLSIETFNSNHKRPKIFVYANNLSDGETTKLFIEEVRKNNAYWREYNDLQQLMGQIKDDIDSELFNIFIFKNGMNTR